MSSYCPSCGKPARWPRVAPETCSRRCAADTAVACASDLTPDWPSMFRFAVQLCRSGLSEGDGRELVIEILEFGARVEAARADQEETDENVRIPG